jgi:3-deoxy-D-manno-octulosonic-acid transferase
VSERSTRGYLRFAPILLRHTLLHIGHIGAQSAADAQRFIRLGADPSRVQVTGNLKFDFPLPPDIEQQGQELRTRYAPGRPMWVAGSTHPGEEEICMVAQQDLVNRARAAGTAAPLLVLAPRRAERFDAVAIWLAGRGTRFARSSSPGTDPDSLDVLLVDTLGELLAFYAAGDVAFVGGSLVPVGGHNLLEPAALGKPTITGPHSFNSPDAARLLEEAHALLRVTDATTLADAIQKMLGDPESAAAYGQRAAAAVVANQGAAARALAMIARPIG